MVTIVVVVTHNLIMTKTNTYTYCRLSHTLGVLREIMLTGVE